MEQKVIGTNEMQKRYGVSRATLYRKIRAGVLPQPCKAYLGARRWFIVDLEEWDRKLRNT